jgi:tetratricopeptide (TPR) repeat protein
MNNYPEILGIYSLRRKDDVGMGATTAKLDQITYWYCRQMSEDKAEVRPLNIHHIPSGIKQDLPLAEFIKTYTPEPRYYLTHTVPAMKTLKIKIDQGEKLFDKGKFDEAEREFIKALMIDDLNVEANYGLGGVYSEKNDFLKLRKVMNTLLGLGEAFQVEHKVRLNKFAITLRKNKQYEESITFFSKAMELHNVDENLYFNLARVLFEKGELEICMRHLKTAIELNSSFVEAQKFLAYCQNMQNEGAKPLGI